MLNSLTIYLFNLYEFIYSVEQHKVRYFVTKTLMDAIEFGLECLEQLE